MDINQCAECGAARALTVELSRQAGGVFPRLCKECLYRLVDLITAEVAAG